MGASLKKQATRKTGEELGVANKQKWKQTEGLTNRRNEQADQRPGGVAKQ